MGVLLSFDPRVQKPNFKIKQNQKVLTFRRSELRPAPSAPLFSTQSSLTEGRRNTAAAFSWIPSYYIPKLLFKSHALKSSLFSPAITNFKRFPKETYFLSSLALKTQLSPNSQHHLLHLHSWSLM